MALLLADPARDRRHRVAAGKDIRRAREVTDRDELQVARDVHSNGARCHARRVGALQAGRGRRLRLLGGQRPGCFREVDRSARRRLAADPGQLLEHSPVRPAIIAGGEDLGRRHAVRPEVRGEATLPAGELDEVEVTAVGQSMPVVLNRWVAGQAEPLGDRVAAARVVREERECP